MSQPIQPIFVAPSDSEQTINGNLLVTGDVQINDNLNVDGNINAGAYTVNGIPLTGSGTVTSLTEGTGITLSPNPIIANGTITNTGVTYLTAGSNITLSSNTGSVTISSSGGGGTGTMTSVSPGTGISMSPNPITTTGTITNSGVTSLTAGSNNIHLSNSTGAVTVSSAEVNGAIVNPEINVGVKQFVLTTGSWVTITNFSGAGTVKKFWFAVQGDRDNMFVAITFDNASSPQIGSKNPALTQATNSCWDQLFTRSFGAGSPFNGCETLTMTVDNGSNEFGGYLTLDMPFSSAYKVEMYNNSGANANIWLNSYIDTTTPVTPLRLFTNHFSINNLTYNNEYPLLSLAGTNGVVLKMVKTQYVTCTGGWNEGRFIIYQGGTLMTSSITGSHYTDSTHQIPSSWDGESTVIGYSTGTEDFTLSSFSWNFGASETPAITESGGGLIVAGVVDGYPSNVCCFRVFKDDCAYQSTDSQVLTLSWTCGDAYNTGTSSGTVTLLVGDIWYYA